jgi:Xaa-Pro aminopeptidase
MMQQTNLDRLTDYFRTRGISAALLSSPWTLAWLTGYAPPIQTGPSPFDGGPALGWWSGDGLTLVCQDAEAGAARATGAEVVEYAGYTIDAPLDVVERQAAALRELLGSSRGRSTKVGAELRFLTAPLLAALTESLPEATLIPFDKELEPLRAIKTADEIGRIRASLALCDQAQREVKALIRPGISEIEVWGQMKTRLEEAAGCRLPLLADLVAGKRTGDIGGLPGPYALAEGDPVMADIVPRLDGYWGDICGIHFVGEPEPDMAKLWGDVHGVLRRAVDSIRPGVVAKDLDASMRGWVRDLGYDPYPHHSGHGIGVSFHEEPRLVPYNDMTLAPGMVVALEPGVYFPGKGGVRLEDIVLVTPDGCELLTRHLVE